MQNPNNYWIKKREAEHECDKKMGVRISAYQIGVGPAQWSMNGEHTVVTSVTFCPFCGDCLPESLKDIR